MCTTGVEKFIFNYPANKPDIDKINIRMMNNIWTPTEKLEEIKNDRISFKKLSEPLKRAFVHIMAYFSIGDQIVNDNIGRNLYPFMEDCPHCSIFYNLQQGQEAIHTWSYNVYNYLVLGLGSLEQHGESKDDVDCTNIDTLTARGVFDYLSKLKPIQRKIKWTRDWTEKQDVSLAHNIIAMVITEGVFFSSSFAFIYWLKSLNEFHGLSHYNDYISRDEALHCEFGWTYYNNYVQEKLPVEEVKKMFKEAVDIEIDFFNNITSGIDGEMTHMSEYVKYMADFILGKLNIKPIYNVNNPYPFMKNLSIQTKSNMFERTNTEYMPISICNSDFDCI